MKHAKLNEPISFCAVDFGPVKCKTCGNTRIYQGVGRYWHHYDCKLNKNHSAIPIRP
jgi:hypothetical protein